MARIAHWSPWAPIRAGRGAAAQPPRQWFRLSNLGKINRSLSWAGVGEFGVGQPYRSAIDSDEEKTVKIEEPAHHDHRWYGVRGCRGCGCACAAEVNGAPPASLQLAAGSGLAFLVLLPIVWDRRYVAGKQQFRV